MSGRTLLARLLLALLLLPLLYGVAAGIGSTVARGSAEPRPASGVTIFVEDNGVHTSIVMPKRAAGVDWSAAFPASDIADPRYAAWEHVAVSWGERGFFVGTPTWWDLRPATVLRAMVGGEATVLHVEHVARPTRSRLVEAVVLSPAQYRRLAGLVARTRSEGPPVRGYAGYDTFYPATGRYDAFRTCNWWTARLLAAAGVRMGMWTPTSAGVMRWL